MNDHFTLRDKCVIRLHDIVSFSSKAPSLLFGLSFLVVTKDNQATIQESLDSISGVADEIIIVDGSLTETKFNSKKAKYHRFRIGEQSWKVFTDSLNFGLNHCHYRWVFKWDADLIGNPEGLLVWKYMLRDLNKRFFYEVDVARVDASKTLKFGGYEGRLFTQHPKVKYHWVPDRDSIVYPLWFRLVRWDEQYIFHKEPK
jgi:glycosyltransferase involved in cell wall biosynthesis